MITYRRYTNWEYEFFLPWKGRWMRQLSEMLTMLINGDLDLMGAMNYTDGLAAILDYPEYSYGTAHKTLSVLKDNLEYTEFDYESFDNIRVAVVSFDGREDDEIKFVCEDERISCESGSVQYGTKNRWNSCKPETWMRCWGMDVALFRSDEGESGGGGSAQ